MVLLAAVLDDEQTIHDRGLLRRTVPLIIEALKARSGIDSVQMGQTAKVRLTALNQHTPPVLSGAVAYVSPDVVVDGQDRRQRDIYTTGVALEPKVIASVRGFTPLPGMPAEGMIRTTERTFAQCIARPAVESMSRAFREQ
jgi:multidrug efflux pump subunit AcrA (membrane-fusion protein)